MNFLDLVHRFRIEGTYLSGLSVPLPRGRGSVCGIGQTRDREGAVLRNTLANF